MFELALAAFAGGIVSGLIGWAESTEKFQPRKFVKTGLAGLIAAAGFALGFADEPVTTPLLFAAFLSGAGADVLSNRGLGLVNRLSERK